MLCLLSVSLEEIRGSECPRAQHAQIEYIGDEHKKHASIHPSDPTNSILHQLKMKELQKHQSQIVP